MPKSTPRPMNRTAKATEIRLSAPTKANPIAAVMERPTIKLTKTAKMIRHDRKASHRMVSTMMMVADVLTKAPSFRVAYSSSAIATGPVGRRFANGLGRPLAGHKRAVVEHRPDLDESPAVADVRRLAVEHRPPGEAC